MKLSKSNIKIILFIVAVAILGLTYLYVCLLYTSPSPRDRG